MINRQGTCEKKLFQVFQSAIPNRLQTNRKDLKKSTYWGYFSCPSTLYRERKRLKQNCQAQAAGFSTGADLLHKHKGKSNWKNSFSAFTQEFTCLLRAKHALVMKT